jgi:hypothetical protein
MPWLDELRLARPWPLATQVAGISSIRAGHHQPTPQTGQIRRARAALGPIWRAPPWTRDRACIRSDAGGEDEAQIDRSVYNAG